MKNLFFIAVVLLAVFGTVIGAYAAERNIIRVGANVDISAEDVVNRLGDSLGVNKLSIRNYANSEVAYVTSQGNAMFQNLYPIGTVYLNNNASVNPATTLKLGTWSFITTELKINTNVSYWERTA